MFAFRKKLNNLDSKKYLEILFQDEKNYFESSGESDINKIYIQISK